MKPVSIRSVAACLLVGGVLVAGCGGGTDGGTDLSDLLDSGTGTSSGGGTHDSGGGGSTYDSGGGSTYDSGGGGEVDSGTAEEASTGGGSCGSCTTDTECQSSCPAVQGGGTNCCDVGSGVCYATTQTTCPVPSDGGTE